MLNGLIVIPWAVTLLCCPQAFAAYRSVGAGLLLKSNLFSLSWGVANVLCMLCFVRIGFCLTGGILTGIGVSLGVTIPLVFKGSGRFQDAANIDSPAGLTVLAGVAVMLIGVILASLAGFGRDNALQKTQATSGRFLTGLVMVVVAGMLSCGISFAFVYSQGPIVEAMKARGASEIAANFAVWAVGLLGGALVNVLYPAYLMTKNRSWHVLVASGREAILALIISANMSIAIALMGKGMLMLGSLGASIGFGVQQAMQMLGGQAVGFIGGEWRGVHGTPRLQMYVAIAVLILAACIMAYGNTVNSV
jgi:L-rhamnose-H+ transport protein